MSDPLNALLHPFAKGVLETPQSGRGVFLRAEWGAGLDEAWRCRLVCEQSFKPDFELLRQQGFDVVSEFSGDGLDFGLILLTKHKAENIKNIARAWAAVKPGGMLVSAGAVDTGAASVAKLAGNAVGGVEILAKYHCKVFWFSRTETTPPEFASWIEAGALQLVPETGYFSQPGIYGWNKIDRGSALLIDHLPPDLTGRVADLGAGWGYLSAEILKRYPGVVSLDLFEAEAMALEAARVNLDRLGETSSPQDRHCERSEAIQPACPRRDSGLLRSARNDGENKAGSTSLHFHWHDVRTGVGTAQFDAVAMNPPFHEGKETDMALGQRFITAAAEALVPGGRLFMVANRQLPYEQVIKTLFRRNIVLNETGPYKVIEAIR